MKISQNFVAFSEYMNFNRLYSKKRDEPGLFSYEYNQLHILGLLDMYFDAAVVIVTNPSLLFKWALAILWAQSRKKDLIKTIIFFSFIGPFSSPLIASNSLQ